MQGRGLRRAPAGARLAAAAAVAALACTAAACGFRLQGRAPLPEPLRNVHVEAGDEQTDFVQGLRKSLLASGARLTPRRNDSTSIVRILEDRLEERVLSVSTRNIPTEYELVYTVRFEVVAGGRELLPAQQITATRDYSFDERTLLAKENEKAVLSEALARDLVGIVMRRLASL